ncbi:MAG: I78 family peptidase inhibitor [Glycocaulis sp.]
MMRFFAMAGASALLAGCATMTDSEDTEPVVVDRSGGECAAPQFQLLVGQLRGEIDVSTLPVPYRIYGRGDAVTMDYRPDRMNIVIGDNDRVERVSCG